MAWPSHTDIKRPLPVSIRRSITLGIMETAQSEQAAASLESSRVQHSICCYFQLPHLRDAFHGGVCVFSNLSLSPRGVWLFAFFFFFLLYDHCITLAITIDVASDKVFLCCLILLPCSTCRSFMRSTPRMMSTRKN